MTEGGTGREAEAAGDRVLEDEQNAGDAGRGSPWRWQTRKRWMAFTSCTLALDVVKHR